MTRIFALVAAVAFGVGVASASTVRDPYICGKTECEPDRKFKYSTFVTYHYNYNVTVHTFFAGTSDNHSVLNIESNVMLEFITPCEGVLKFEEVKIRDQDEKYLYERQEKFSKTLSGNTVRFAFHNGVISEVCSQEDEEDWVLNFKRGLLSLFQNSMTRLDIDFSGIEQDIHGTCNTQYQMKGQQNTSLIITKSKDFSKCLDRYNYQSILQTVKYNYQSKEQKWSVLQSENHCVITVDHNIYTKVLCKEKHLFDPFSGRNSGAMTTVLQDLNLVNELNKTTEEYLYDKDEEMQRVKHRYNLFHHHTYTTIDHTDELRNARNILKEICRVEEMRLKSDTSEENEEIASGTLVALWGNFVRVSRGLSYSALNPLYSRTECPQAKKYIIDALPYIASVGSVKMITNFTLSNEIDETTQKEWLLSIAMIPRPKKEMIQSLGELLVNNPHDKTISLVCSSVIHSYCKHTKTSLEECGEEEQNLEIIKIFENNILNTFRGSKRDLTWAERERVLISLKSLGNIGGFTKNFKDLLMELIEEEHLDLSIRIYAVEAFRRSDCSEMMGYFLELFRKQSLDVEIRLASYLQVMRCPQYLTISEIFHILEDEKVHQVASFVWSHLENLEKSSIPSRVEKQGLLSSNHVPKFRHRQDFRKFSRNYEQGIFFDKYNVGGNYEANVIMSPDSYIPRSVSVNLTLDMFGESINILELNARGEGFEKYIESLFTSKNPLHRTDLNDKLKKFRFTRDADNIKNVTKKINDMKFNHKALRHRYPILDVGMKVFGNELSYWSANGDDEIQEAMRQINPLYHIKKILAGKNISYKKSTMFLDTSYSIPTGAGLPLALNMMGMSIANLKMSGLVSDTENFFHSNSINFEGKMHPSMAVSLSSTMSVNAGNYVVSGIRVNFQIHTATALSTVFQLKSGKMALLNVSLPHTKQEIFEAKSSLIVLHGNDEVKQNALSENTIKQSTCSWPIVEKAIGIKMCANYELPNMTNIENAPYFILGGPAWYQLSLEKTDPTAKVYSFMYFHDGNQTGNVMRLSFDTPGSLTKRMFNTTINYKEKYFKGIMNFHSAENHLRAQATYKKTPEHVLLECNLDMDGQKHFDGVMSLTRQEQKNGYVFIPQFYVAVNDEKITELVGTLKVTNKKGVSQCDVSLEFQTKKMASRLIGYITWNGPSRAANLRLDYQFLGEQMETIRVITLYTNKDLAPKRDIYAELELDFTSYPRLNFYSNVKYVGNLNHMDFNFNLSRSRDLKPENMRLLVGYSTHRLISGSKMHTQLKFFKPYMDINLKFEENGALKTFSATMAYDNVRHVGGLNGIWGRLYMPLDTKFYLQAGLNATVPTFTPMVFNAHLYEKENNEYDISVQGVWFTGVDASFKAIYQDLSSSVLTSRGLKAVITGSQFKEIDLEAKYSKVNKRLNINIEAKQDSQKYAFVGRYILFSDYNISCYGQVDIKSKTYSVNVLADLVSDTHLSADIHFDKVRDIQIIYSKIVKPMFKKLTADVSWDVNRDPNQKLTFAVDLHNKSPLNHKGSFVFLYPGRLINGEFETFVQDWQCSWNIKLGWSPDDNVLWKVKLYTDMKNETVYALMSQMTTPFEGWKDTHLDIIWKYLDNMQKLDARLALDKQKLSIDFLSNYLFKSNEAYGELNAIINSTIKIFPTMSAIARHHHIWKKSADTLLSFEYNEKGKIMVNSSWAYDKTPTIHKVVGKVQLRSPFKGYKTGLLGTTFKLTDKRNIDALTNLQLEENIYTISIDGHTKRFTNSILNINITSPLPQFSVMRATFGLIDTDRHLVAMIKSPNFTTGVEAILKLSSSENFHVYGHMAIPVQFLHNIMIQAKRNAEEVDFRLGFENMTLGFTGIWHYKSDMDFQYLYKLYTPLVGWEENGLVLKNIYGDGFDSEASIRLSKYKLGAVINIKEDGSGVLRHYEKYYKSVGIPTEYSVLKIEDFSTELSIVVDTLFYDTISVDAALNKVPGESDHEIINFNTKVIFKNTTVFNVVDKLVMENIFSLVNDLHIQTPFVYQFKVKSVVDVIVGEAYNIGSDLKIHNGKEWSENSIQITFEVEAEENEKRYLAIVQLATQLESLKSVDAKLEFHQLDFSTKFNSYLVFPSCEMRLDGQMELDDDFLEAKGNFNATSPYFQDYFMEAEFKKDFADIEQSINAGIKVRSGNEFHYLITQMTFNGNTTRPLKIKTHVSLIPIIQPSVFYLMLSDDKTRSLNVLSIDAKIGSKDRVYSLLAEYNKDSTKIDVKTPERYLKRISFTSKVNDKGELIGTYEGDSVTYNIKGDVSGENPKEVKAILKPNSDTEIFTFHMLYSAEDERNVNFSASLIGPLQFTLKAHVRDELSDTKKSREVFAELSSSTDYIRDIFVKGRIDLADDGEVSVSLKAATPIQKLETVDFNADIMISPLKAFVVYNLNTTHLSGDGNYRWSFMPQDLYLKAEHQYKLSNKHRKTDLKMYYEDKDVETNTGLYINFDDSWTMGSNATLVIFGLNHTEVVVNLLFPKPNVDVHTFAFNLNAMPESRDKVVELKYSTDISKVFTKGQGKYSSLANDKVQLNVTLETGSPEESKEITGTIFGHYPDNNTVNIETALRTPWYKHEDTMNAQGTFICVNDITKVRGLINYPGSNQIANFDVKYGGWTYTVGEVNISTPLESLPWLATKTRVSNEDTLSESIIEVYWNKKMALFNSTHKNTQKSDVYSQLGDFYVEIPLNTTHKLTGKYDFYKSLAWSKGTGTVFYNSEQIAEGNFNSKSDKTDGFDRHTVNVDIDNIFKPVGVHYIHKHKLDGKTDMRQVSVYQLKNESNFNLTGSIEMKAWRLGKQIDVMIIQKNRSLSLQNHFETKEKQLYQGSRIDFSKDSWFEYVVEIENKTVDEYESHELKLNVNYPKKLFNVSAIYHLKDNYLDGEAVMDWSMDNRNNTIKLTGEWENDESPSANQHDIKLMLSHPNTTKNVTLVGRYYSDPVTISNISTILKYSDDDDEKLTFDAMIKDHSDGASRLYKVIINSNHKATDLDLHTETDVDIKYNVYLLRNYYKYQKGFMVTTLRQGKLYLNLENHTAIVENTRDEDWHLVNGRWSLHYPEYKIFVTVNKTNGNDSGFLILSTTDKSLIGHYNSTDEFSYHLIGKINDARSAQLNAWKNFEDIVTNDVSSYIKLNHSKLLTSRVAWRPEMIQQIKNTLVSFVKNVYLQTDEALHLLKEVPMETHEALKRVWSHAKPKLEEFVNEENLNFTQVILEDIEAFRNDVNVAYDDNDFYIKDIVEYTLQIVNELSLRDHIENIPAIVSEMWQIMGSTGSSLKESISWVIDTVKNSYTQFMEQINDLMERDLMDQVSDLIEGVIIKYDSFVKTMHLEFLSYCDALWKSTQSNLHTMWKNLLHSFEPTYLYLAHYVESYLYQFGKEVLSFFYARTEELTETPFFGMVSQLAKDLDRIWKDLNNNDVLTNIKKYSEEMIDFFKRKILIHIPFQKEITDISKEIMDDLNKLEELLIVKSIKSKFWEVKSRLEWWYDYFNVGHGLKTMLRIGYKKIMEVPTTALQLEESNREAKTNFIFDPNQGLILLEQKLPMPWHAFNTTPVFSEIPEYKLIQDAVDTILASNVSLLSYYYQFKTYTDITNAIPPFSGHAVLTGHGSIITFDHRVFSLKEEGMYLLASDFLTRNFTVLTRSNKQNHYDLVLFVKKHVVNIDLFDQSVTIGDTMQSLPIKIGDWYIERDEDDMQIENDQGVSIKCSFIFKTCTFTFDGSYFARLAGLFGTMNNEYYDDFSTPNGEIVEKNNFIDSWRVLSINSGYPRSYPSSLNHSICESYFSDNVSPLKECFNLINPTPFYSECLDGHDPCILAKAYSESCFYNHIPTRIPPKCMECVSHSHTLDEGSFGEVLNSNNSTDVVFIVETHECNENIRRQKNIDMLINSLESKLIERGFHDNRYAVVRYGSYERVNAAQSLYVDNKLFTVAKDIPRFFDHLYIDQRDENSTYNTDTYEALSKASSLSFRPGVSKIFILYPCTKCDILNYRFDYSIINQVLTDSSTTLHIIMDKDFTVKKRRRLQNVLYGIDSKLAYTSKDAKTVVGDASIRKLVSLPKPALGFCTSLAIESNGTIFTSQKMKRSSNGEEQKVINVFAERAAISSVSCPRTRCECHATKLRCTVCPRNVASSVVEEISSAVWTNNDIEDYIDNFFDRPIPTLWG